MSTDTTARRNVLVLVAAQGHPWRAAPDDLHHRRACRIQPCPEHLLGDAARDDDGRVAMLTATSDLGAGCSATGAGPGSHFGVAGGRWVPPSAPGACRPAASSCSASGRYSPASTCLQTGSTVFAAVDTASEAFRPKAISWVMAGGLLSAVVGPQLVKVTADAMAVTFGSYLNAWSG